MQRMQKIGPVAACPSCDKQPHMYSETARCGEWFLECSRCGTRTPRFDNAAAAIESWERHETGAIQRNAA